MPPTPRAADGALLRQLLLGQLPADEAERLAVEWADDARLADIAESLTAQDDGLLEQLRSAHTLADDSAVEQLVERLLGRLQPSLPSRPRADTAIHSRSDTASQPTAPVLPLQSVPNQLEYFRPIKVLGQGGMGTVYLAEDTRLGREVALKTLKPNIAVDPQAKERFLREARTAARLEHDHIIPIYYVGDADGVPFLAMPLLKGESLDSLIRRTTGPLPVSLTVRLAREMSSGLSAAHARGLIHRDIKPGNIWLEAPHGRVKILDFGLAKAAGAANEIETETQLTTSGAIVGTPAYMAPEQAASETVNAQADLFSLGCILYEMLTGQRAFGGVNTMAILTNLALNTPAAPHLVNPRCPLALSQLVMRLLEKSPENRPATAQSVIEALAEIERLPAPHDETVIEASRAASAAGFSSSTTTEIRPSLPTPNSASHRPRSKLRTALALGGFAITLLAAAVVYYIQTNNGRLAVTLADPEVQAILETDGLVVRDKQTGRSWTIKTTESKSLPTGDYAVNAPDRLQLLITDDSGAETTGEQFTLKRQGQVRVQVTLEKAAAIAQKAPTVADPDRRAAEWVLSIGGMISIKENGLGRPIEAIGDLPQGKFDLASAVLNGNTQVNDAGLARFKGCKNLQLLRLNDNPMVSDAGVAHFQDCKGLMNLYLANTKLSDAGLAYFQNCKHLIYLTLNETQISDAGLAHIKDCKKLALLDLNSTQVSDAGLERLAGYTKLALLRIKKTNVTEAGVKKLSAALPECRIEWDSGVIEPKPTSDPERRAAEWVHSLGGNVSPSVGNQLNPEEPYPGGEISIYAINLDGKKFASSDLQLLPRLSNLRSLGLTGSSVDDAGLVHIGHLPILEHGLSLRNTQISDDGLVHLRSLSRLQGLNLDGTRVTDAGLAHLPSLKALERLNLCRTGVTAQGIAKLHQALPGCRIEWDGGVIEPKRSSDPDRRAAEWVLSIGGKVAIDGQDTFLSDAAKLPKASFQLTGVLLDRLPTLKDEQLAPLKDCRNLTYLSLWDMPITDAGLAHLPHCEKLTFLNLENTRVTDSGLATFKNSPALTYLNLTHVKVTDEGLKNFQSCSKLKSLNLRGAAVTDAGLSWLKNCTDLTELWLDGAKITDASLAHIRNATKMVRLDVRNTKVTSDALQTFHAATPGCTIDHNSGTIKPASVDVDRRAAEWVLSQGGTIRIDGLPIVTVADLPQRPFELTWIGIPPTKSLTDEALKVLLPCERLQYVGLADSPVGDDGIANLRNCRNLLLLNLYGTKVTDRGLAHFTHCKELMQLDLGACNVSDDGLVHLQGLTNLEQLHLEGTRVSDAGLRFFANCRKLQVLKLHQTPITDQGLAVFAGLDSLTDLFLGGKRISDEGVVHFRSCRGLTTLSLISTSVTDAGLAPFQQCTGLTDLRLSDTRIGDDGLAYIQNCANLARLELAATRVTDEGLALCQKFPELTQLSLGRTNVTNAGLQALKDCPRLKILRIDFVPSIDDDGLVHLQHCRSLSHLELRGDRLTDKGLTHLAVCRRLTFLDLRDVKLTAEAVQQLAAAIPGCRILWDGGQIDAQTVPSPDRQAAEWLASIGGTMTIVQQTVGKEIKPGVQLPAGPLELTAVRLDKNKQVSDEGLAHLQECENILSFIVTDAAVTDAGLKHLTRPELLRSLDLSTTQVTDAGLSRFSDCTRLVELILANTRASDAGLANFSKCRNIVWLGLSNVRVSDAGLSHFKDCQHLLALYLNGTNVGDAGLANFRDRPKLQILAVDGTQVTDSGVAHFAGSPDLRYFTAGNTRITDAAVSHLSHCRELATVNLDSTYVSDAGLEVLAGLPKLKSVGIKGTKVSAEGVKKLSAALPQCRIEWDGGTIEPAQAAP